MKLPLGPFCSPPQPSRSSLAQLSCWNAFCFYEHTLLFIFLKLLEGLVREVPGVHRRLFLIQNSGGKWRAVFYWQAVRSIFKVNKTPFSTLFNLSSFPLLLNHPPDGLRGASSQARALLACACCSPGRGGLRRGVPRTRARREGWPCPGDGSTLLQTATCHCNSAQFEPHKHMEDLLGLRCVLSVCV